jgi:hypothetical protein
MFPLSRREWLAAAASGLAGVARAAAPGSKVALARCPAYGKAVTPVLRRMFDQLGGIGSLVSGKTVAIKINMANPLLARTGHTPAWFTGRDRRRGRALRRGRRRAHPHP